MGNYESKSESENEKKLSESKKKSNSLSYSDMVFLNKDNLDEDHIIINLLLINLAIN